MAPEAALSTLDSAYPVELADVVRGAFETSPSPSCVFVDAEGVPDAARALASFGWSSWLVVGPAAEEADTPTGDRSVAVVPELVADPNDAGAAVLAALVAARAPARVSFLAVRTAGNAPELVATMVAATGPQLCFVVAGARQDGRSMARLSRCVPDGYVAAVGGDDGLWLVARDGVVDETLFSLLKDIRASSDARTASRGSAAARATMRWAERYYREWRAASRERDLDRAEIRRRDEELAHCRAIVARLEVENISNQGALVAATARVRDLEGSTSWRVTAPLRRVVSRAVQSQRRHERAVEATPIANRLDDVDKTGHPGMASELDIANLLQDALEVRVSQLAQLLGDQQAGSWSVDLVRQLSGKLPKGPEWWATFAILVGKVPTEADLDVLERRLLDSGTAGGLRAVLDVRDQYKGTRAQVADVEIIRGEVVIDASHTAQTSLQSGVQRVVRNVVPAWEALGGVPLVFDDERGGWRRPTVTEHRRMTGQVGGDLGASELDGQSSVVVPVDCTILIPELKPRPPLPALRCASRFSGNRVRWIVYDLIPILASEYVPDDTVAGFADYLSVVKFSDCVSAISASTAVEFTSYSGAMVSQGFIGPSVTTQPLPLVEAPPSSVDGTLAARAIMTDPRLPLVLCVASISPHKNQSTLLEAAIRLHADGVRVELVFVAPNAWNVGAFRARMDEAVAMGMHVQLVNELSDETLWALYRRARCVALISRVEGYGLPIVEAISVGTPVLASNFGSMAEIAKDGGVLTVDPWDMAAVTASLGSLVTDDDLHAQLSAEARGRARGTWDDYARQTWHALVDHQDVPTEGSL